MNHIPLFFIINLATLLSLNAKPKFFLVEIENEHSTIKYADYEYEEVLLGNFNSSEISNETDNSSEISKKRKRSERESDDNEDSVGLDNRFQLFPCIPWLGLFCSGRSSVPAVPVVPGGSGSPGVPGVPGGSGSPGISGVPRGPGSPVGGRPPNRTISPPSGNFTNNTDCGKMGTTRNNRNRRIFGGEAVQENEIPWMCAIMNSDGKAKGCGATLLNCNPVVIVTAAHCVSLPGTAIVVQPQSMLVSCGTHTLSQLFPSIIDKNEVRLQVTDIVIHPEYTASMTQVVGSKSFRSLNDIAILKVENSLPCSKGIIYPACLPTKGFEYVGWNALISGWGKTSHFSSISPILKKAMVPIVSDTECSAHCAFKGCSIPETQVCAAIDPSKATCHGDSGGPIMAQDNLQQGWSLVGALSWGFLPCGTKYSVFTEVSHYLDWIAEQYGLDPPK